MMDHILALQQLTQNNRALAVLKMMVGSDRRRGDYKLEDDAITIHFYGSRKASYCKIAYDEGADLYNMSFYKIWRGRMKQIDGMTGIYCDQLKKIFERVTGLYLDVPQIAGIVNA